MQTLFMKMKPWVILLSASTPFDYKSFATADEAEKDDLKMISGIVHLLRKDFTLLIYIRSADQ